VVAGTGSIAAARNASGVVVRAGGTAPPGGDPGGGAWLGEQGAAAGIAGPAGPDGHAALAPLVLAAAEEGRPVAVEIVRRAARALVVIATEAAGAAALGDRFVVRVAGGLVSGSPVLLSAMGAELARAAPGARLGPRVEDPLAGALIRARRELGSAPDVPPG
jgi:N-acetylglucosamine kinase-like BadF-type ATPase